MRNSEIQSWHWHLAMGIHRSEQTTTPQQMNIKKSKCKLERTRFKNHCNLELAIAAPHTNTNVH